MIDQTLAAYAALTNGWTVIDPGLYIRSTAESDEVATVTAGWACVAVRDRATRDRVEFDTGDHNELIRLLTA